MRPAWRRQGRRWCVGETVAAAPAGIARCGGTDPADGHPRRRGNGVGDDLRRALSGEKRQTSRYRGEVNRMRRKGEPPTNP